jgi:regulator of protease activity HflC (stomatin/prohibitin superfamily)
MKKIIAMIVMAVAMSGCHIVDTGKVGLRTNFDKTVEASERISGSFNQTIFGSVEDFPIKEISLEVKDMRPPASDNSPMGDFDITVVYNINPTSVSDLYINKSRSFHAVNSEGETLLMYEYLQTTVRNAVYKVAREYDSINMNNSRSEIEVKVAEQVRATLASEKLGNAIVIGQVQVKSIEPPEAVKQAAIRLVAAKAENAAKDVEVATAVKEAARISALNANKGAIEYMDAQARLEIAYAMREGKVNAVVVPYDFKGIVSTGK